MFHVFGIHAGKPKNCFLDPFELECAGTDLHQGQQRTDNLRWTADSNQRQACTCPK